MVLTFLPVLKLGMMKVQPFVATGGKHQGKSYMINIAMD